MPEPMTKVQFVQQAGLASMSIADENYETLGQIAEALHAYHSSLNSDVRSRYVALHLVHELCGLYFAEDETSLDALAVETLHSQVQTRLEDFTGEGPEAKTLARANWRRAMNAVKPLLGGGQKLHEGYWIELAAPHLSVSGNIRDMFNTWKEYPTAMNFVEWLQRNSGGLFDGYSRVGYDSAEERKKYRVELKAGALADANGLPFHTGGMRTAFSGTGWAIFVRAMDGTFYSGSHIGGQRHHSSFLEGRPVLAAGEWAVDQGRLVGLKNKSGHYRPTVQMLHELLQLFFQNNVQLAGIPVLVDAVSPTQRFYDASQLLGTGGVATTLTEVQAPPSPPVT